MKDLYIYKDSDILINKVNNKEKNLLDEFENRMLNLVFVMLFKSDFKINNVNDVFKIYKILFDNVYDWVGKFRMINIYKSEFILNGFSVEYSLYNLIDNDLSKINLIYFKNNNFGNLSREDFIYVFI